MAKFISRFVPASALASAALQTAAAGDITYQPRTPSFGDVPLYFQHMLGRALKRIAP